MRLVSLTDEEREQLPEPAAVNGLWVDWVFMRITDPEFGTWPFGRWLSPDGLSPPEGVELETRRFYKLNEDGRERWMRVVERGNGDAA